MTAATTGDFLDQLGLETPVIQAGMGGGVAGGELAGAVSAAGGLGTVGMMAPKAFAAALRRARLRAPGRPVAANLLVPFIRQAHIQACAQEGASLVVLHGGISRKWVGRLREHRMSVFITVGTAQQARVALAAGADGLVLQGSEAGGHLVGVEPLMDALAGVLDMAGSVPVLAAGGVADAGDVRRLLDAGATAAVAGTRFLLTDESAAHPVYKRRVVDADQTLATLLFGFGWPLLHRVIPNAATDRWCQTNDLGPALARASSHLSAPLGRFTPLGAMGKLVALQGRGLPFYSPALPLEGMSPRTVDSSALYAGETATRIGDVISAAEAVRRLAPRQKA